MPSGSQKSHRRQQCSYRVGRDRCRRDGSGNPALCNPHKIVVAEETRRAERTQPGGAVRSMIDDFFNGRPITGEKVASAINDIAWGIGGMFGAAGPELFNEADPYDADAGEFQHERDNRNRPPGEREYAAPVDEAAEKRAAIRAAKIELGFAENEPVTMVQVKARHRELARRHHPDRPGGSVAKMQRINAAVDLLEHAL